MQKYIKLNNFGYISRGKSKHRPRNDNILFKNGNIPFIQTSDVKKANLYINNSDTFYNETGLMQSKLWKKGTLCITIAANIAETAILGIDACFPDSIVGFIPKNNCNTLYIKYCFDVLKNNYQKVSSGTSQENLNIEQLGNLMIPLNSIKKQQHIVDIIGTIDRKISNLEKIKNKIELILDYTFSYYFTNSLNLTNKKMKIGDIITYSDGFAFKPETYKKDGKYKIITIKNVQTRHINSIFDNTIDVIDKVDKKAILNIGDVIMSLTGNTGRVGINYIKNALLNQRVAKLMNKYDDKNAFIYSFLKRKEIEPYTMSIASGTSQKNLSMIDFLETKIPYFSKEKIIDFDKKFDSYFYLICKLEYNIILLQNYKDKILPLLLNNQII